MSACALALVRRHRVHCVAGFQVEFFGQGFKRLDHGGQLFVILDRFPVLRRHADAAQEADARRATSTLYHVASAVTLAWEGVQIHAANGDARRLLLSKLVVEHRLHTPDPFALSGAGEAMAAALLDDAPVPLATALDLLG